MFRRSVSDAPHVDFPRLVSIPRLCLAWVLIPARCSLNSRRLSSVIPSILSVLVGCAVVLVAVSRVSGGEFAASVAAWVPGRWKCIKPNLAGANFEPWVALHCLQML
jgi:hypothetical protein